MVAKKMKGGRKKRAADSDPLVLKKKSRGVGNSFARREVKESEKKAAGGFSEERRGIRLTTRAGINKQTYSAIGRHKTKYVFFR